MDDRVASWKPAVPVGTWLPAPEQARVPAEHQRSLPEQRSLAGIEGGDINMQQVFAEDPGMAALARSLAQSVTAVHSSGPWAERPAVAAPAGSGGVATRKRSVTFSLDSVGSATSVRSRERGSSLPDWDEDEPRAEHQQTDCLRIPPPGEGYPARVPDSASRRAAAEPQPGGSFSSTGVAADVHLDGDEDSPIAFQRRLERELAEQLERHRVVGSAHQLQALRMGKLGDEGGGALAPPVQLMSLQAASELRRAPSGDVNRVYRGRVGPELRATCPMLCSAFPYGTSACVPSATHHGAWSQRCCGASLPARSHLQIWADSNARRS